MITDNLYISTTSKLKEHIATKVPSTYAASKTSTVTPFDGCIKGEVVNLTIPGSIKLIDDDGLVRVEGNITWHDLKDYLNPKGRDIKASPTEHLASVLAGIATSATGEKSFGNGTLKNHVVEVSFINFILCSHNFC